MPPFADSPEALDAAGRGGDGEPLATALLELPRNQPSLDERSHRPADLCLIDFGGMPRILNGPVILIDENRSV